MKIDTSYVLSYIEEMRDAGCSPLRQPHEAKNKSRQAFSQDHEYGMFGSFEQNSPLGAMEEQRDDSLQALDAIVDGVVEEIIRDTTAATSAALKSVQGSATAMIFPPSPSEREKEFSSTPEAAASSSPTAALLEAPGVTTTPTTRTTMNEGKSEGQKLLSRSQARRKNLQQSYNQIMSSNLPITIQEQHDQYQQQSSHHREEHSDCETHATIKSPRVRQLYDFDIHDRVEEYTPKYHQSSDNTTNAYDWDSARIRREHRTFVLKSAFDIDEIDQLTKEMRLIQRSPKVNDDDDSKQTKLQQLVKEFEEEWNRKPTQTTSNLKRQSHYDTKKKSINEEDTKVTAVVATRWKALQTKPQEVDNKSDITISSKTAQSKKEIADDELEAWWKERRQNAKQSFSASERFDIWWENQKENKNKKPVGGGGATAFQELEGEPTVEENVATNGRKRLNVVVPPNEDDDAAASSGRDSREGFNKEQRNDNDTQSSTAPSVPNINEDMSNQSQSHANNVASGTLSIVLSRVDEAKEQFVKALEDNDVQKQSELAALLARLGEAAAAMRKLGQL